MSYLTESGVFLGILTTIMTKPAVRVETVMFIVQLMKNSSMCHKNCEKTSELYSLKKVIIRKKFFNFFASVLGLNYVSMENNFNHLSVNDLSYLFMGCPRLC